ncbi:hypothetical protein ASPWEDRAFT_48175 [Aspergillus wentii DTO 134E9]|uniref:glucan endo-1,3-beta-D-glucosidase n=1 Tax=Aspergillus wentii DTO 134E9 TaxID=1073089 RepID=A0A1L9S394_ASPWE|nr:uncharacterized protein ASPWEDRAFT_48175 [Aspergillus wentii DTO 134E9]KAI9929983.1 hypothetical protein MW887_011793 [Aspergillus wentii]OJJ41637.1 hypothetical protein ASPWEDRAFT_48175 [Aspergillus wentii DTO 134E9]
MSGGNRVFSFNPGDDGNGVAENRPISPIPSSGGEHNPARQTQYSDVSPVSESPPHHFEGLDSFSQSYGDRSRTAMTATPGVDDLGPAAAGGGIGGIALGIANNHDRQSGIEAFRGTDGNGDGYVGPPERGFNTTGSDTPYIPTPPARGVAFAGSTDTLRPRDSYGSNVPLGAAGAPAGQGSPGQLGALNPSQHNLLEQSGDPYQGVGPLNAGPYQRQSAYGSGDYPVDINPDEIADDGDDGFHPAPADTRRSQAVPAAAAGGAATGGILGGLAGLFKGKKSAAAAAGDSTSYNPVPGAGLEAGEKSRWAQPTASAGSKKRALIVGLILGFIVVGAIVGGAVGGILGHKENEKPEKTSSATEDSDSNGDLNKNSKEIKDLMNNKELHKVFPGVDYTPWGVQYPLCLKYPPSQNNVTRDMAVLSQLTNTVRLYGTDCNQTEMVLHAIDRLELTDMKLWLGVWIDTNKTTTERQINKLYDILDNSNDTSIFKGAIVGNEALFRAGPDTSTAKKTLISYMQDVKDHFKSKSIDLPVATSDLGDNWDQELVKEADLVMSNVHPFFAGVSVDLGASWTWDFWQEHDVKLTQGTNKKQVISEVGWPSSGGNDCGSGNKCPDKTSGSVAGIDEMNQFMSDWICQALDNGTDYFWFEAFDEPWKVQFNTEDQNWEDKWGLMDADRKVKPGLKIPDCGGKPI